MSKGIIVKENKNPEIKFLKVSVICWCFAGQGEEVELPLVGSSTHGSCYGSCYEGAEKDPESKVAKNQHGSD